MIINSSTLRAANNSIRVLADTGFTTAAQRALLNPLLMTTTERGQFVTLAWLASLPGMKKLLGEPKTTGLRVQDYSFENFEWEDTLAIKAIDLFRDRLGLFSPVATMLGTNGANHPFQLVGDLLVNAFTQKDYTGSAFFAANKKAWTGAAPFTNKGTKKLSAANFEAAYTNITTRKNAFGLPMRLGNELILVVSPTNEFPARSIVETPPGQGQNPNPYYNKAKVLVLQDLATNGSGDEWFLMEVGLPVKPLCLNLEIPFSVLAAFEMDTRDYVMRHEFLWQGYYSGGVGYGLPELAYGSDGTAAA